MREALALLIASELEPHDFSTGSKGFRAHGKIVVDGVRYQAQAQAVLVGSKNDPDAKPDATPEEIGDALSDLLGRALAPKEFRSGRTGHLAIGKVEAREQRYQASIQAVRLS